MPCRTVPLPETKALSIAAVVVSLLGWVTPISAQTSYNVIAETDWSLGVAQPLGGVIKASNGVFYGTGRGGSLGCGGVYKIALDGTFSVVHALAVAQGCVPLGELVQGADGHLYGTTSSGGPNVDQAPGGTGTVFRISLPDETFSVIHAFDNVTGLIPEGYWPYAGLTLGPDNALYGTTNSGGQFGFGTIFKITSAGVFTVMHSFVDVTDGQQPQAGLTLGPDGNFYGTTTYGPLAANGAGTIYKITPAGSFTTLFTFAVDASCLCTPDGINPIGEPVIDAAGNLYGIALGGGPTADGSGTIWKLSPAGELTVLKAFTQAMRVAGSSPLAGLTFGRDGYLYGTTGGGGQSSNGTVFRITPAGAYEVLHSFEVSKGLIPDGRLLETSPGVFMGTTQIGGASNSGVVFRLTVPVVDVDVNEADGPLTLHTGNPFQLTLSYQTNDAGIVNPARIYVGVQAPFGLYWLRSTGFSTVAGPLYSGPVPAIPPATLLNVPNAAALPAGTYYWFMLVDTDGPGDAFDFVQVTVAP